MMCQYFVQKKIPFWSILSIKKSQICHFIDLKNPNSPQTPFPKVAGKSPASSSLCETN